MYIYNHRTDHSLDKEKLNYIVHLNLLLMTRQQIDPAISGL